MKKKVNIRTEAYYTIFKHRLNKQWEKSLYRST